MLAVLASACADGSPCRPPAPASARRRHGISSSSPSTRCGPTGSAPTATPRSRRRNFDRLAGEGVRAARRHHARANHPAVARLALHRPVPGRARRARQHLAAAGQRRADAGRDPDGAGLRHRGLRLVLRAVVASRASIAASTITTTPFETGTSATRRCRSARCSDGATRRSRASSSGSTRGRPRSRSKRTALWVHLYDPHDPVRAAGAVRDRASPTGPTTARWRGPTRCSDGCAPAWRRGSSGTTPWSSSPPTTARPWASTTRPATASSPTRPRSRCRS